jgi:hypothetical protein
MKLFEIYYHVLRSACFSRKRDEREKETREKVSRESLFLLLGTKEKEARETNMVWDPCFSTSSPNCEER